MPGSVYPALNILQSLGLGVPPGQAPAKVPGPAPRPQTAEEAAAAAQSAPAFNAAEMAAATAPNPQTARPLPVTVKRPGVPEKAPEAAQAEAAPAPVAPVAQDSGGGLLDSMGLGGAKPYLRAAGAGLGAVRDKENFWNALGQGFSGAQASYAEQEALAAKQAREDAEIARRQANEDREFNLRSENSRLDNARADRAATRQEKLDAIQLEDRQMALDYKKSPEYAAEKAEEDIDRAVKRELTDMDMGDERQKKIREISNRVRKSHGLGTGFGTEEDPFEPTTNPKWAGQDMKEVAALDPGAVVRIGGKLYQRVPPYQGKDGKVKMLVPYKSAAPAE